MGADAGSSSRLQYLWTPHRAAYDPATAEDGACPLCLTPTVAGPESLVVARGTTTYAVLNRHPYTPGHLMVIPYRHVADLADLTPEESVAIMSMTSEALNVLRSVGRPDSFNVGLNLGRAAGASIARHLHQHVVPRWSSDGQFIAGGGDPRPMSSLLEETRTLLTGAWPGGSAPPQTQ